MNADKAAGHSASRILVVDDESSIRNAIRDFLSAAGHEVDVAPSGEDAIRMHRSHPYDVLLVEAIMPGLSGFDVFNTLRASDALPPFVVMVTLRREDLAIDALRMGAVDCIVKDDSGSFVSQQVPAAVAHALAAEPPEVREKQRLCRLEQMSELLKRRAREGAALFELEQILAASRNALHVAARAISDITQQLLLHVIGGSVRVRLLEMIACSSGYPGGGDTREFPITHQDIRLGEIELSFRPGVKAEACVPEDVADVVRLIARRVAIYLAHYKAERSISAFNDELNKLSLAVDQSPNSVVITNARFQIEYVNEAFTELTGYTRAEVLGRNPKELVRSNQMDEEFYSGLRDTILAGRVWRGEIINRRKNGEHFWDETIISPLRQPNGRITHYVAVKQDISDRKFSEMHHKAILGISAALAGCRFPEDVYRTVVELVRSEFDIDRCALFLGDPEREPMTGTYGTDESHRTVDERERIWDIRQDAFVMNALSSHRADVVVPLDRPHQLPNREALVILRRGGLPFGLLSVDNRTSGRKLSRSALFHISMLSESVASSTQRELVRERLRETIQALREKNASLEEFARVASHDLQEPLRKIENFASILVEDFGHKLDKDATQYLDIMTDAARRMRQLIRDVLAFSRAGNSEQMFTEVDLNRVLAQVKDNLSLLIGERQAEIIVQPLPTILAAETQMVQLFQNLIANGLKYNKSEKPVVEIWGEGRGAEWLFHVRDNGIGIDANNHAAIFTPFRRLHAKEEYEGSGIGLASCKRIVNRHGGEIGVVSEKGDGSTFWFTILKHPRQLPQQDDSDLIQILE